MATRKIKVLSTLGVSGTIETNVTTLGELKPLLEQREINITGMKLMVGETRNELNLDDAKLPEGDFKLYLMPAKTKSGARTVSDIAYNLAALFEELGSILANTQVEHGVKEAPIDEDLEDLRNLAGLTEDYSDREDWL